MSFTARFTAEAEYRGGCKGIQTRLLKWRIGPRNGSLGLGSGQLFGRLGM